MTKQLKGSKSVKQIKAPEIEPLVTFKKHKLKTKEEWDKNFTKKEIKNFI